MKNKNKSYEQQINLIVDRLEKSDASDDEYSFLDLRDRTLSKAKLFTALCFLNLIIGASTAYIATSNPEVRGYTSSYTAEVHPMTGLANYEGETYYDIYYVDEDISKTLRVDKQDLENL